jgi:hypothetical protein
MTKVEVTEKSWTCLQSDRALHLDEVDAGIKGCDRPFLRPGYRVNKICSRSVDQGLSEALAD